jgi:micrococcal nuclease
MLRRTFFITIACLLPATAPGAAAAGPFPGTAPTPERVAVVNVFDGDTIVVMRHGRETTVRLIGVDTPETSRPDCPVQFFGPEASEHTRSSLLGKTVRLVFEPDGRPGGSVDRYGRVLAYVFTGDGRNFNLELVRSGYGRAFTKYPFSYEREFRDAERAARKAGIGIWDRTRHAAWSDPSTRGTVIGNIRTHIYHLPGQRGYDKVREKNRVYFPGEKEAAAAGYRRAKR